jgi:hypothetical protein
MCKIYNEYLIIKCHSYDAFLRFRYTSQIDGRLLKMSPSRRVILNIVTSNVCIDRRIVAERINFIKKTQGNVHNIEGNSQI